MCNVTAVLKVNFIYKQSKNEHPQIYIGESKYIDAESRQFDRLIDSDDNDWYFEVWKEIWIGVRYIQRYFIRINTIIIATTVICKMIILI